MKLPKGLLALAALTAVPLAALGLSRAIHRSEAPQPKATDPEKAATDDRPNVADENAEGSEPGGTLVVLGLFAILAAVATFIAAFVFPPGYVAAVLVFGLVSLLGLVVLYVHYRAHHPIDDSAG